MTGPCKWKMTSYLLDAIEFNLIRSLYVMGCYLNITILKKIYSTISKILQAFRILFGG